MVDQTQLRITVRALEFSTRFGLFNNVRLGLFGVFQYAELLATSLQVRRSFAAVVASVTARTREPMGQNVQ